MKIRTFFTIALLGVIFGGTNVRADTGDVDFFKQLYDMESSFSGQYQYLVDLAKEDFPDKAAFFSRALNRLIRAYTPLRNTGGFVTEGQAANNQAILIFKTIAVTGASESTQYDILQCTRTFSDGLVISEALIALGKLNAVNYYQTVLRLLDDTNAKPNLDKPYEGERIAYGAIESLKYYGDTAAYIPIFLSISSWYSDWVKQAAVAALNSLSPDPFEPLKTIILESSYPVYQKNLALEMAESSNMPNEKKAELAMAAFSEGYRNKTINTLSRKELTNLRKYAMTILRRTGTNDDRVYQYATLSYRQGVDDEERLDALVLLGSLKTEKSVDILLEFLEDINELVRQNEFTGREEAMVRSIITNLGNSGARKAAAMLQAVLRLNYSAQIQALARESIAKITG
jgi:HEAT repeat protein